MHLRHFLCFLATLAAGALLPGCQTAATFPTPTAEWQTLTGQMQYVSAAGKSVIGDVVVRRSKQGDLQLAFSSGPGFPLMRLSQSGTVARAEGVLARGSWQGAPERAPQHLRGWIRLARTVAAGNVDRNLTLTAEGERFVCRFGS